ncbi:uncharacterized protein LOC132759785 isoform X2 [Ruditapes philippinarum]|uniref:uncharacterized protein LOC132759785 isoform X2 n=1 Tax=Ruditapes philippinarum TaxID=129788 RepID=UPI00295C004F|nr:uncharacterized protein LOC132759785 isoform X2 [Ruditapes philippinarum]
MMKFFSVSYQSLLIMNGKLIFCIFVICLLETAKQKFVEENTNFQYSRCKQISDNVLCEALNISKGSEDKASLWPPGPFAIPMSQYGCPESESRGWTQSVLDMRIKKNKHAKQKKSQIKLCVKVRHDTKLDTESWIPGRYTIYKIGEKCPPGFRDRKQQTAFFEYDSYGIIPNISVHETAQPKRKKLSIATCDKIYTESDVIESNVTFGMLKTNFKLIKKGTMCPMSTSSTEKNYFCGIVQVADDKAGSPARLVSGFDLVWNIDSKRTDKYAYLERYQIDLRRSMHVSIIEMVFNEKKEINQTFKQCWYSEMNAGFLYGEALKCNHTDKNGRLLLRHVRARYITLDFEVITSSLKASKSQLMNQTSFKIFTTDLESMNGELCNEDLGMSDGSIQNNQIFASSRSELYQPFASRPSSTGWCHIKVKDANPWIMVDLMVVTKIEGVTIYASNGANIHSRGSWNSFRLLYGNQTNNLKICSEKLKTDFDQSTSRKHRSFLLQTSITARLIKLELNESGEAEEICLQFEIHGCKRSDAVDLFPSFKEDHATIITNALYVQKSSIIMSIGYPFLTGSDYCYSWIIDFNHQHYVKLIFTNITLNQMVLNDDDGCDDKLILGTDLQEQLNGTEIDNNFNERVFIIETNKTFLVITFQLCFHKFKGSRFRAVVTKEDIPACLSIGPNVNWSNGRKEFCINPEMILTSMSILNNPFDNFEERFRIRAKNHHGIEIEFIDFYIVCPIEITESRSRFKIIERNGDKENTYCNTNKPPEKISSEEETLLIVFRKYEDPTKAFIGKEGFRLHYRTKNYSLANWTEISSKTDGDMKGSTMTTVCSQKFKKCYKIFSSSMSWSKAGSVCGKYDQCLVTIQSPKELQYINYLLRDQRYVDRRAEISDSKGSSYKAHIGLKRKMVTDRKENYVWLNNYEVIFSPWAIGEPTVGDCTCTNFRSFIIDRTLESEYCNNEHNADYFICQSDYNEKGKEKFASKKSKCNTLSEGNKTKINYSYSGKLCQNWSNLTNNALIHFNKTFDRRKEVLKKNSTLCQDPYRSGIMGCYVNDSVSTWEPCFFSLYDKQDHQGKAALNERSPHPTQQQEPVARSRGGPSGSDSMTMAIPDVFFVCSSTSRRIPWVNKCDKTFHCEDKTDEVNCTLEDHELAGDVELSSTILNVSVDEGGNYYQCGSKEWISMAAKCDTVIDCLDASDEIDCIRQSTDCNANEFACADGSCIKLGQVCDFKPDCTNAEDEFCELRNCGLNEYVCGNKQCIQDSKRCDSIPHCIDGSDEIECLECRDSFHCDGDRCIDNKLVCDKVRDCEDGSDESDCTTDDESSCEKWWRKGYFESGQRVIGGMKVYCDYGSRAGLHQKITLEIRNLDLDAESNILHTESSKYLENSELVYLVERLKTCTVDVSITFIYFVCHNFLYGYLFSRCRIPLYPKLSDRIMFCFLLFTGPIKIAGKIYFCHIFNTGK